MIKIPVFLEKLSCCGIEKEKCDLIIKTWSDQAKNIHEKCKAKTVLPLQVCVE